jgi:hypothetical protein
MKTDDLIDLLARDAGPAPTALAARRVAPVILGGALASLALSSTALGVVPAAMFATAAPWFKLAYAGALALAAALWLARLGRPAAPAAAPLRAALAVFGAALAVGVVAWAATPAPERMPGLMGHSWAGCPVIVLTVGLPALAGGLWALRGLAPTRPRAAGAAAGLLAGALGAFGYAFSCTEGALSFVALWYTLGIAASTALGAVLGPRVLRW